jgi:hypothetical protein
MLEEVEVVVEVVVVELLEEQVDLEEVEQVLVIHQYLVAQDQLIQEVEVEDHGLVKLLLIQVAVQVLL